MSTWKTRKNNKSVKFKCKPEQSARRVNGPEIQSKFVYFKVFSIPT